MRIVYPVFIKEHKKDYLVFIPDLAVYTEGKSFPDAIEAARDAIGLTALEYEDRGESYPAASDQKQAIRIAKNDSDDTFDYSDGILTFVDVDMTAYRAKIRNRSVKKNCTIPGWLNEKAERAGINFSRVLQDALISILGEE